MCSGPLALLALCFAAATASLALREYVHRVGIMGELLASVGGRLKNRVPHYFGHRS